MTRFTLLPARVLPAAALLFVVLLAAGCTTTGTVRPTPPSDAAATETPRDPELRASEPDMAKPSSIASPVVVPLNAAALASLPREPVTFTAHGHSMQCEGVSLLALLRANGTMPAEALHGEQLSRYVLVGARDGYRVLFSLAELDPTLGGTTVYLSDRCDGKPLSNDDGPLRLIVKDAARPARSAKQVVSIVVIVAP
jgi:hypothetical protein